MELVTKFRLSAAVHLLQSHPRWTNLFTNQLHFSTNYGKIALRNLNDD